MGAIIVTDPARAKNDGTPQDVDREFATLFMIFDESDLDEAAREAAEYGLTLPPDAPLLTWSEMRQQIEAGSRFAIDVLVFGNLPGLSYSAALRTGAAAGASRLCFLKIS